MTAVDDPRPLCFVLMPFGTKPDQGSNVTINFDAVYEQVIRPAVEDAGLRAIRADEEKVGGIIHKPMFERLILCDYAVADLTTANANVYYELGIRHAMRPWSTVLIFADGVRLPFDLGPVRGLPYHLDQAGNAARAAADRAKLAGQLRAARAEVTDSPLFQLLDDLPKPDISRLKTDVFREQVEYSNTLRERLAAAREQGADAVRAIRAELGNLGNYESGVLVDVLLSFRDCQGWSGVRRRIESTQPDYWDYATLLELGLLGSDQATATNALENALAAKPRSWQVQSTLETVQRLRRARAARGTPLPDWAGEVEQALAAASQPG